MIITNKELRKLLEKAGKLVEEVREIGKKIDDLEGDRNVLAIEHQKVKEEIMPLIKPYIDSIGEFEDVVGVEVVLDADKKPTEEIEIKVVDRLEEWKRLFTAEKTKQKAKVEEPKEAVESPYTEIPKE